MKEAKNIKRPEINSGLLVFRPICFTLFYRTTAKVTIEFRCTLVGL